MTSDNLLSPDMPVDLTNCDREPIHQLGHIQSFGFLFCLSSDWSILKVSENVNQFLPLQVSDLVGEHASRVLTPDALHDLRSQLQMLSHEDSVERVFHLQPFSCTDYLYDVALHMSGRSIILEFERSETSQHRDYTPTVRSMIGRVQQSSTLADLSKMASRHVRALTGFDRVMVYRFAPDGSGEVVAESKNADLDPYLNLRYPASDIPQQARALYVRNPVRIISDVHSVPVKIVPATDENEAPLDLSLSTLRSVSPIHIEYLRNMGVAASMSLSITYQGKLWGLIACHHYRPMVLSFEKRTACELFAQMLSFLVSDFESRAALDATTRSRTVHDRIMAMIAEGEGLADNFDILIDQMAAIIQFDGAALAIDDHIVRSGTTPSVQDIQGLLRFLNTTHGSEVYAADSLSRYYPQAQSFASHAAGLLALPVSRRPRDYLLLFRRELRRTVTWAGDPRKSATVPGPNGPRLTPRKSFEAWQEELSFHSAPWTEGEIAAADSLRVTLLEVVLRMTAAASEAQAAHKAQQDILIAELNHRVRNILNLIRGVITQSNVNLATAEQLSNVLEGRIDALARAHDQITDHNWGPQSVHNLINIETEAYGTDQLDRVKLTGTDAYLVPSAATTLSLVVHELTTNAVKYGALSVENGSIEIQLTEDESDLVITWRESGGPTILAPSRKGFGSTLIEKSIPYDLGGDASVSFPPEGLRGKFRIPGRFIDRFWEATQAELSVPKRAKAAAQEETLTLPPLASALIVEDNLIIALDTEEMLSALGVKTIDLASNMATADRLISKKKFSIVCLDINLGGEESFPLAERLSKTNTPHIFTTGFGAAGLPDQYETNAPILKKPYRLEDLKHAIARACSETLGQYR
ncbi:hypothetical protein PB2503_10134 [Parvularcula bermudensis HTCC2503]|uniref:histidine kinase n=1 Tax=Parvularcula bermudensis (strain ATCC BAA-594 / HTCC2503 / KCTC 12087) TaxID=314260 RepID=E0TEY6_PARBH|nr:HWE histidine kinase domain-containing protein [Parvularcula bermudensis]ADM10079.1 hypothetical protein PB2503_10134 [Parvularcula bermudensis HTCC2503]